MWRGEGKRGDTGARRSTSIFWSGDGPLEPLPSRLNVASCSSDLPPPPAHPARVRSPRRCATRPLPAFASACVAAWWRSSTGCAALLPAPPRRRHHSTHASHTRSSLSVRLGRLRHECRAQLRCSTAVRCSHRGLGRLALHHHQRARHRWHTDRLLVASRCTRVVRWCRTDAARDSCTSGALGRLAFGLRPPAAAAPAATPAEQRRVSIITSSTSSTVCCVPLLRSSCACRRAAHHRRLRQPRRRNAGRRSVRRGIRRRYWRRGLRAAPNGATYACHVCPECGSGAGLEPDSSCACWPGCQPARSHCPARRCPSAAGKRHSPTHISSISSCSCGARCRSCGCAALAGPRAAVQGCALGARR